MTIAQNSIIEKYLVKEAARVIAMAEDALRAPGDEVVQPFDRDPAIVGAAAAAAAVVGARALGGDRVGKGNILFIGCGHRARAVFDYLRVDGWNFGGYLFCDKDETSARILARYAASTAPIWTAMDVGDEPGPMIQDADLVVLATGAKFPHLSEIGDFQSHSIVLALSPADLTAEAALACQNVVANAEADFQPATTLALVERASGGRDFVKGDLAAADAGELALSSDAPRIFWPGALNRLEVAISELARSAVSLETEEV